MPENRVLVIGLDGGTFDLIEPWAAEGDLPNLAGLMASGCRGRLASTLQPTTAPAWVTFMTGVNQGQHGLYDFVRRQRDSYNLEVTNASHIAAPTLFDLVGQAGLKVIAVNVPYTFPVHPVNGVMIGGPFAPAVSRDLTYPPAYFDVLKSLAPDYFVFPDYDARASEPLAAFADNLLKEVELRERLCLHLLQTEPWDLAALVFMATDEAQHTFWDCQAAPEGSRLARYRHVIRDVYRRIDAAIGRLLAQIAGDGRRRETLVVVMSDHGAGPLRWMINLNHWLAEAGYLRFHPVAASPLAKLRAVGIKQVAHAYRRYTPAPLRSAIRSRLGAHRFNQIKGDFESALLVSTVDWDRTRAYALGSGGNIFVNLVGREPRGLVQPGAEYEQVCRELAQALAGLADPDTGRPIVQRVYRREELYHGDCLNQAPDLIIQWKDYTFWGRGTYGQQTPVFQVQRKLDFSEQPLSGAHRPDGILILAGPGVRPGARVEGARLVDLAPTILSSLGLPIPERTDGSVLRAAFGEAPVESLAPVYPAFRPAEEEMVYTPEEADKIMRHLQDLGYF